MNCHELPESVSRIKERRTASPSRHGDSPELTTLIGNFDTPTRTWGTVLASAVRDEAQRRQRPPHQSEAVDLVWKGTRVAPRDDGCPSELKRDERAIDQGQMPHIEINNPRSAASIRPSPLRSTAHVAGVTGQSSHAFKASCVIMF